jgi:hypothetical protein
MSSNLYNKISTSGTWVMDENEVIMWKETTTIHKFDPVLHDWINEQPTAKLFSPEDSPFKCVKKAPTSIIIMLEKQDLDSSTGTSIFFYERKIIFEVKSDYPNVWLTYGEDGKVYCKDLLNYVTFRLDPSNNDYVRCKKINEKRITKETAKELSKTTSYIFSKQEEIQGETIFGKFVAPKTNS